MLKLPEELRSQICEYLSRLTTPVPIGATLMQIVKELNKLEKLEDEPEASC
jgi:hypothetical protein